MSMRIDDPQMWINNESIILDVPPMLSNGRTLVPVRAVAEGLGAVAVLDDDSQTVFN